MDIAGKCASQIVLFSRQHCLYVFQSQRKLITLGPDPLKDLSCFWAGTIFHSTVGFFVTLEDFGSTVVGKNLKTCFEWSDVFIFARIPAFYVQIL